MNRSWKSQTWGVTYPSPMHLSVDAAHPGRPLIVYLHGMGESGMAFNTFWPGVAKLGAQVVAPSGPFPFEKRSEQGIRIGHAWYLYDGGEELFRDTAERVEAALMEQLHGIESELGLRPSHRVLLGYSMGAYFGYLVALKNTSYFSHMIGVSGNLKESFLTRHLSASHKVRCLILHGQEDTSVPVEFAERTHQALSSHGHSSTLRILPGGHGVSRDRDLAAVRWLEQELALSASRDS